LVFGEDIKSNGALYCTEKKNSQIGITTAVASLEPSNNSLKPLQAATSLLKALNNLNLVTASLYQRQIVNWS